ncbi:MAG: NAD(P)H-dependent oxidoreductase [Clostridia bacterium]|nr:NAD(P)H-dependent oxidoreductase [Clostridia bacterium]
MKLLVSFSARSDGNCDQIAAYAAAEGDRIVHYRMLDAHACSRCTYECFQGPCRYHSDDVYTLYQAMAQSDQIILIVPMYGGHPCSLYFAFQERGQDYFATEEAYDAFIRRLFIIGVYGSAAESPGFLPCLEQWFEGSAYQHRVLGLERHRYGQNMADSLLAIDDVLQKIDHFLHTEAAD